MTDHPARYWVAYNARIRKHVVIEAATGEVVAERVTREAAKNTAQRLADRGLWDCSKEVLQ